jgi:hypothetical protein
MSSIEEEDEPTTSDELTVQPEKLPSSPLQNYQQLHHSPSVPDWDSELSESEQEFDDNDEDPNENGEERAANRALQNFMQTCSRTVCITNIFILTHKYITDDLQSDHIYQGYLKRLFRELILVPKETDTKKQISTNE